MVNYGKTLVYVDGVGINPLISTNGHYMINIFDDLTTSSTLKTSTIS